jgi:ATP-binding cassette subfamily C protein LapB
MANPIERPEDEAFIHRPELSGEIEFRDVSFSIRIRQSQR